MSRINIVRGDTPSFDITVTDNGSAFDLTGYTMRLTVKRKPSQSDSVALIGPLSAVISTPSSGVGTITFSESDTDVQEGIYYYDVQISNGGNVFTVIAPTKDFVVEEDITKTS